MPLPLTIVKIVADATIPFSEFFIRLKLKLPSERNFQFNIMKIVANGNKDSILQLLKNY